MCKICVKTKAAVLNPAYIHEMILDNRDGFGMAWVEEIEGVKRVKVVRSMGNLDECVKLYQDYDVANKDAIIHTRNASYGEKILENCHPYTILSKDLGDSIDLVMMHNGSISGVQVDTKMSDSWNFAVNFLRPHLKKHPSLLQDTSFCLLLSGLIGGSKLVFLDSKNRVTIINDDLGSEQLGCWWSFKGSAEPLDTTKRKYGMLPPLRLEAAKEPVNFTQGEITEDLAESRAVASFVKGEPGMWITTQNGSSRWVNVDRQGNLQGIGGMCDGYC